MVLSRGARVGSLAQISDLLMLLGGLIFVVTGLYRVLGRYLHDAYLRARTSYGLTNQRVLILTTTRPPRLQSLELADLEPLAITRRRGGRGTITFKVTPPAPRWWQLRGRLVTVPLALVMIRDPERVAELIRRAALDRSR